LALVAYSVVVIIWIASSMLALIEHPKAYGEVFNIGHTKEISIYELAGLVKQMIGSASKIVLVPYEEAYEAGFEDMARRAPDIRKIQGLIGSLPKSGSESESARRPTAVKHKRITTVPTRSWKLLSAVRQRGSRAGLHEGWRDWHLPLFGLLADL
jgi:hypothetical protein